MNKHPNGPLEAEGIIGDEGTSNLGHPGSLPLPQTMVLKVIGVHCPRHLQCHLGQTMQTDPGIPDKQKALRRNAYEDKPPHL